MIEINLLPPQYRTVERTPLPVFLGLIGAIVIVAGLGLFLVTLNSRTRHLEEVKTQLAAQRETKAKEVDEIKRIERELQESQGRINTVLEIAESKIYWAIKLDQLTRLFPTGCWLESLIYDGSKLRLLMKARGTSLQRYTDIRQKLRNDTNFIYNFGTIPLTNVEVVNPGSQFLEPAVLAFTLTLPIREVEPAPAPRK